jgi:hypothetical protein
MGRRGANMVLWASLLCFLGGVGMFIYEKATGERGDGAVFVTVGVMGMLIGQVLFRLTVQVEALEQRLGKGDSSSG